MKVLCIPRSACNESASVRPILFCGPPLSPSAPSSIVVDRSATVAVSTHVRHNWRRGMPVIDEDAALWPESLFKGELESQRPGCWRAYQVAPRAENVVARHLRRCGVAIYCSNTNAANGINAASSARICLSFRGTSSCFGASGISKGLWNRRTSCGSCQSSIRSASNGNCETSTASCRRASRSCSSNDCGPAARFESSAGRWPECAAKS
jgi:hypothetical protein